MMDWLLVPFETQIMRDALMAVVLVAVNCALVGTYVVLRRMAFMGDALAHTILPGIVFAYLRGFNMLGGALISAIITALGIGWISRRREIREDTAIGVVFTAMFALGVLMMSFTRTYRDLHGILFGSLLTVDGSDLLLMFSISVPVYLGLLLMRKELELSSYDHEYADQIGIAPNFVRYILLVFIALTVVTAIQAAGVLLTSALLITPAAAATLVCRRVWTIMILAVIIGIISGISGLLVSFHFDVTPGASIVLVCTLCFGIAWIWKSISTLLRQKQD